jgi:hypothetical protein
VTSLKKTNQLMVLKEITAVSSEDHSKHTNTPQVLNTIAGMDAVWNFCGRGARKFSSN